MSSARTKPSTRRLSEVARHVIVPDGIATTGYPGVRDKCAALGIVHDDWQQDLGRLMLAKRKDGKYAATVGGVVISIPRQVGKTFTVGSILVGLGLLFPGSKMLWTAHRTRTSNETFASMKGMTSRKKVKPFMLDPRSTNGEQEIRFRNGSRILFGAREQGFGRGFDAVEVVVFDEAQILTEKALEDMVPTTSQPKHPAGALLFYMGTPPRPSDPGEVFTNKRDKALSGKSKDMVYVELSADRGADPDDRKQWAVANPSYPLRTPLESMQRLRENVGSDESFLREGLGVWDDASMAGRAFGAGRWEACGVIKGTSSAETQLTFGLAVSLDRKRFCIAVAGQSPNGKVHVDLAYKPEHPREYQPKFVVAECKRLQDEHGGKFVVDGKGPAAALLEKLLAAGVEIQVASPEDVYLAHDEMFDRVQVRDIAHLNHPTLNSSVAVTEPRSVGDRTTWRRTLGVDTSPTEAATLASWPVEKPSAIPLVTWA